MLFADKLLFRPEAVQPKLAALMLPPEAVRQKILNEWVKAFQSKAGRGMKESELLPLFIADMFGKLLGYVEVPAEPYTLKRESLVKVDGKYADAALGHFAGEQSQYVVMVEGKGPKDPLDIPFGRKLSAVDQALQYAVQQQTDWYIVTNLREIRLYHKGHDTYTFERFDLKKMAANEDEFRRFVFLLGAERVLAKSGNHLDRLLVDSARIGRELTNEYYREYRQLRENTFAALRRHNPEREPARLLAATQKLLDRILFIAFAEDRQLMPRESIKDAYKSVDKYNPRPVWDNFKSLFRAVDAGDERLNVAKYNGGLFQKDDYLESLIVPDSVCEGFNALAAYEYSATGAVGGKLIDVEILGHIFEQSITDLEEMQRALDDSPLFALEPPAKAASTGPSKRKKEGAFYTPPFVTRYIVEQTLGAVLKDRFEELRTRHAAQSKSKLLADPVAFDPEKFKASEKKILLAFWSDWHAALQAIRIVDPACGSGAFLMEAFDRMAAEYRKAEAFMVSLGEHAGLFKTNRTVLTRNLFGMDLNSEAIEIARLSCWIKTAEIGEVLTTLDDNVKEGNSIVAEPSPLEAWKSRFPEVFADGGFDVVIGNPPYVRQEWIKADKPFLQQHYKAYDGVADLYVYFYELGLNVLKPGGRLGFIVTNKWMKAGYGENLRQLYGDAAWVEQVVDFGHAKQIFPDADVFPCIVVARKPTPELKVPAEAKVCVIPREQLRVDDLSRQIETEGVSVPRSRFGSSPWNLEPAGVAKLMEKIKAAGMPLRDFAKTSALSGIKTGFNDAYLIDAAMKDKLVSADSKSASLFKPYLRGQDIGRWHADWKGLWMIAMKSSANHDWQWTGKPAEVAESIFAKSYPALYKHFVSHRNELINRQDQGEYWWELRQCAYWAAFDKPKIIYPEITWRSDWCIDTLGQCINNTVYIIPTNDLWIVAVANSAPIWAYAWRHAQHGKDEALRFIKDFVEELPIPNPNKKVRVKVENAVSEAISNTHQHQVCVADLLTWLRVEFDVEKPTQRLQAPAELSADALAAEVRKVRGKAKPLTVAAVKRLADAHAEQVLPLQALAREALHLERLISDEVNAAFGLTPEDVKLMWQTAPPRMPIPPPG